MTTKKSEFTRESGLVFDIGSGCCKIGYAGEDAPRFSMPSCGIFQKSDSETISIGNDALLDTMDELDVNLLSFPISRGVVKDWEQFEKLLDTIFSKLETKSDGSNVLISEPIMNPKENRIKIAKLLFEKYKVSSVYFGNQASLGLFSTGRTTGLTLDVGHGLTQTVPIFEGFPLRHASLRFDLGGIDLTEYLKQLLSNCDIIKFNTIGGLKILNGIKEKLCQAKLSMNENNDSHIEYTLPDRKVIKIGNETYQCVEALFNPKLINKTYCGIHEAIQNSYEKCDDYIKQLLSENIVLSGASTMFKNLKTRILNELTLIENVKICDPSERKFSVWIGASMLASLHSFKNFWITKESFDTNGESIIFSKCI